jgi:hypothetical protein
MTLASIGVILCLIGANFHLPAFFPSAQDGATYVTVAAADECLDGNSIIYAVEINGDVRGYPRKHLEIQHIAGDTIGGEEVAMTFCALSNLLVVIDQNVNDDKMDLGILIQTHNNLLMVDNNSGELIQQITGTGEFSGTLVQTYPNDMMTWASPWGTATL